MRFLFCLLLQVGRFHDQVGCCHVFQLLISIGIFLRELAYAFRI